MNRFLCKNFIAAGVLVFTLLLASQAKAGVPVTNIGFTWDPVELTVTVGTQVDWTWTGTHNVGNDPGDSVETFDSGIPTTGGSGAQTKKRQSLQRQNS